MVVLVFGFLKSEKIILIFIVSDFKFKIGFRVLFLFFLELLSLNQFYCVLLRMSEVKLFD